MDSDQHSDKDGNQKWINPLLLPEILERLFSFSFFDANAPKSSLLGLRLVCRAWNLEATRRLLRHRVQVLASPHQACATLGGVPFQNFKLVGRGWDGLHLGSSIPSGIGLQIRELHLTVEKWSLADWRLFFQTASLPVLTVLRLRCPTDQELYSGLVTTETNSIQLQSLETLHVYGLTGQTLFVPLLIDLVRANLCLKQLHLLRQVRESPPGLTVPMKPVKCVHMALVRAAWIALHRLESLHLEFYLTNTQLGLLSAEAPPPRLQNLAFCVQANVDSHLLQNLLSLVPCKTLELHFEWMATRRQCLETVLGAPGGAWQGLEQLRTFRSSNASTSLDFFLRFTPNLQTLSLCETELRTLSALPFRQLHQLRTLEISSPSAFPIEDVCYLCSQLNRLSLEGEIPNSAVRTVISNLPHLQELWLVPHKVYFDESALIGHQERDESIDLGIEADVTEPRCICELDDLRDLHLESNPSLTDGVVKAVGHCRSLRRLTLKGPKLTCEGLRCLTEAEAARGLTHLVYHGREGVTQESKREAIAKMQSQGNFEFIEIEQIADEVGDALNSFIANVENRIQNCVIT